MYNDNNDIIEAYTNSLDLKKYWLKNREQFTPLQLAYLVWQNNTQLSLAKYHSYKDLAEKFGDYPVNNLKELSPITLGELLKSYLEIKDSENNEYMEEDENAVFSWEALYKGDSKYVKSDDLFHTESEAISDMESKCEESRLAYYRITRRVIGEENYIEQIYERDPDDCVYAYETYKCSWHGLLEAYARLFEDIWLEFPTPFKRGDILVYRGNPPYGVPTGEPFVLLELCTWGSVELEKNGVPDTDDKYCAKDRVKRIHAERGDISDMCAYGCFIDDDGRWYTDNVISYLDLEYYKGELNGKYRLLALISAWLKGDIKDILTFTQAYEYIAKEEELKKLKFYPSSFDSVEEYLNLNDKNKKI